MQSNPNQTRTCLFLPERTYAPSPKSTETPMYTMLFRSQIKYRTYHFAVVVRFSVVWWALILRFWNFGLLYSSSHSTSHPKHTGYCLSANSLPRCVNSRHTTNCPRLFHQRDVELCWNSWHHSPIIAWKFGVGNRRRSTSPEMIRAVVEERSCLRRFWEEITFSTRLLC